LYPYRADTFSFPQCFGPKENEPLDPTASESAFKILREQIVKETGRDLSMDEMVRLAR
jgi:5-oxoprolinase (ATP-hydrolysing)